MITKGLRIIGDRWMNFTDAVAAFEGSFVVKDLPPDQVFVASYLARIDLAGRHFVFKDCEGAVHLSRMSASLRIVNCAYLTDDDSQGGGLNWPIIIPLVVEDSVAVFSNGDRCSGFGPAPVVKLTRSKVTFIECRTVAINPGDFRASAVEIIDSDFTWDKNSYFRVGCDLFGINCPPIFIKSGNTSIGQFDGASMDADQRAEVLNLFLRNTSSDTTMATMASLPGRPVGLPNGTLYLDLPTSVFLFLGQRPFTGPIVSLPIPRVVEKLGVPITIQSAELINGNLRLSLPITIVL